MPSGRFRAYGHLCVPSILALALLLADKPAAQEQTVFRSDVDVVSIYATVRNKDGRLVTGLTAGEFQVLDEGRPVEITQFSSDPQPLAVALMLDVSMDFQIQRGKDSADLFIDALSPADRATVGTFGMGTVALRPSLSSDRSWLKRVLDEELWPVVGWPPQPWDAIERAMSVLAGQPGRKVVLLLSAGGNGLVPRAAPLRLAATNDGVMIYSVVFAGTAVERYQRLGPCPGFQTCHGGNGNIAAAGRAAPGTDLAGIVRDTGGGQFVIRDIDDLSLAVTNIVNELRQQYLLGFVPKQLDSRTHRIAVKTTTPDASVRHRASYGVVPK